MERIPDVQGAVVMANHCLGIGSVWFELVFDSSFSVQEEDRCVNGGERRSDGVLLTASTTSLQKGKFICTQHYFDLDGGTTERITVHHHHLMVEFQTDERQRFLIKLELSNSTTY